MLMTIVQDSHFGGNMVLTKVSTDEGSSFLSMLDEVHFSNLRYPGGGVTEDQTWDNGGLQKVFGKPMDSNSDEYVLTLREAFQLSSDYDTPITVVIPTFQFYNADKNSFDQTGFDRYIGELEKAIKEFPNLSISGFEIGNEYWAELDAAQYGFIANKEITSLNDLNDRLEADLGGGWNEVDIGIQAGAAWRPSGSQESKTIADQISLENREIVDVVHQHAYPNPYRDMDHQKDLAFNPANIYKDIEGFSKDVEISFSEFNIGHAYGDANFYGVNQGGIWIEEFGRYIDAGVDSMDHWGLSYKWLTTKFYDTQFSKEESNDGSIFSIATPMGQVYDLASSHLIGKSTMSDGDAKEGILVNGDVSITGFSDESQRVVFFSNTSGHNANFSFDGISSGQIITAHHIIPADSPVSTWYDESTSGLGDPNQIIDARGDMKVVGGEALENSFNLGDNEMLVVVISDKDRDVILEGAHNVTDSRTGMVDDHINGGDGDDILRGHVGDDTLVGGKGSDVLNGGSGDDLVRGGEGSDFLLSSSGSDTLHGEDGGDVFLISGKPSDEDLVEIHLGKGADLIVSNGTRDVIVNDFSEADLLGFDGLFSDAEALADATLVEHDDLIISLPDGGDLTITGGANIYETLEDQVIDFMPSATAEQYAETSLKNFSQAQLDEIRADLENFDDINGYEEVSWDRTDKPIKVPVSDKDPVTAIPDGDGPAAPMLPVNPQPEKPKPNEGNDEDEDPQVIGGGNSDDEDEDADDGDVDDDENDDDDDLDDEDPRPDHEDQDEDDDGSGSGASGGACFVATAAYGDPMHPDVVALRAFRDTYLVRSGSGRAFIRFYWWFGPKLAARTAPQMLHAKLIKRSLSVLVKLLVLSLKDLR